VTTPKRAQSESARREIELLEANERYYRESVALLRAKLYKRGEGSSPRLLDFERSLERAERRLREYREARRQP
jgi:hypothetical protein